REQTFSIFIDHYIVRSMGMSCAIKRTGAIGEGITIWKIGKSIIVTHIVHHIHEEIRAVYGHYGSSSCWYDNYAFSERSERIEHCVERHHWYIGLLQPADICKGTTEIHAEMCFVIESVGPVKA